MRRTPALLLAAALLSCNALLDHHPGVLADASVCIEGGAFDPHNCGACGHDCLGGACNGGACQPVMLAGQLNYPSVLASDDASLYWANFEDPSIAELPKDCDGGCTQTLLAPTTQFGDINAPAAVATDGTNVYWTNSDGYADHSLNVYERHPDGTFVRLGAALWPNLLAVSGGYVYWTNRGATPVAVTRAHVDVTASGTTFATRAATDGAPFPGSSGIVADDTSVFWMESSGDIFSTPVGAPCDEGSTCAHLGTDAPNGPWALAMDATNLYWSNQGDFTIKTMPKSGGTMKTLARGAAVMWGGVQALVVIDGTLYWGDFSDNTIRSMKATDPPCDQTTCTVLARDQRQVDGITADALALYWTTQVALPGLNDSGTLMRLAR